MDNFYVYILYRADGTTPFYVGKGRGDRWLHHEKSANRERSYKASIIRQMKACGMVVPKRKVGDGLSNEEACALEIKLIAEFGRSPNGPLANLTAGGDGVVSLSPESLEKLRRNTSAAQKGRKYGPEWRAAISAGQKGKKRRPHSASHKLLIAEGARRTMNSRPGFTMNGRKHSEETKKKMREAALGRVITDAQRRAMSVSHKGLKDSSETRERKRLGQLRRWRLSSNRSATLNG